MQSRIQYRRGFTVVEMLVTIGVIGLLAAISLPAIQQSRETARRVTCLSHLHQIGVAAHNHFESHKILHTFAPLAELLPAIGEPSLVKVQPSPFGDLRSMTLNREASPSLFTCPSDPWAPNRLAVSYLMNEGTNLDPFGKPNGMRNLLLPRYGVTLSEVSDGSSQTAMFAEALLLKVSVLENRSQQLLQSHRAEADAHPLRFIWYLPRTYSDPNEFANACADSAQRVVMEFPLPVLRGNQQLVPFESGYTHLIPPNQPGCTRQLVTQTMDVYPDGHIGPSSLHAGGANVLMVDGSAKLISATIDRNVWSALGTINGAEVVPEF